MYLQIASINVINRVELTGRTSNPLTKTQISSGSRTQNTYQYSSKNGEGGKSREFKVSSIGVNTRKSEYKKNNIIHMQCSKRFVGITRILHSIDYDVNT
uniref:Uncharacterized protein n=1 Tax=Pararge aegeria TaxID=116150 RepID=S4NUA4_9NEOP